MVELPVGRDLAIEDAQPFTLHFGHDGWKDVTDLDSTPGRFGMHSVALGSAETSGWSVVDFKRRYAGGWEQSDDHHVAIVHAPEPKLRQHSGA